MQWFVPATILPADLKATLDVIDRFLETPIELEGKKAESLLKKTRRKKRKRRRVIESDEEEEEEEDEGVVQLKKRKEKKKKEKEEYKSAQFIEDSDEEYGDMEAFLEKEKGLRERAELAGAVADSGQAVRPIGMRAHGRKMKKKKKTEEEGQELEMRLSYSSLSSDDDDGGELDGTETGQAGGFKRPVSAVPRPTKALGSSPGDAERDPSRREGRRKLVVISDEEE